MPTFKEYARYNSGTHFLDSGSAYGRHHEKDPIADDAPMIQWDKKDPGYGPTIESALFLEEYFEIDDELHHLFDSFCERHTEECWFTVAQMFMEAIGYTSQARDNICNGEHDMSQVWVWEVWTRGESDDWIYDNSAVTVIHIHTGCDVRGGYSAPLFCKSKLGEYCIPFDLCCGYDVEAENGERMEGLSEQCSPGYSLCPFGKLESVVGEWLSSDDLPCNQMRARIDGEVCIVTAYAAIW